MSNDSRNPIRRRLLQALAATLTTVNVSALAQPRTRRVFWFPNASQEHDIRKAAAAHAEWRGVDLSFHDIDTADLRKLVAERPDAMGMVGNHRLGELAQLTRDIPIVFYNLSIDPVGLGIVEALRRPGKNFTGTVVQWNEITTKYWQLLKEVRPGMKRGAVLKSEEDVLAGHKIGDKLLLDQRRAARRAAAENLGIELHEIALPTNASETTIAEAVRKAGAEALEVDDPFTAKQLSLVRQARIPTAGYSFARVRRGARLIGVSFDWHEGENQAIAMVARILRGERPATMPIYQTRAYGVAVNLKMAQEMGIEIPPSILIQAAELVR